jgi:two-component system response regulator
LGITIGRCAVTAAKQTILLIDDNDDDIELMRRVFVQKKLPYDLAIARDGQDALNFLQSPDQPVIPALILLDLNLPKMDGLQTLSRIRCIEPMRYVPVVILTTSQEQSDIAASYRNGANSYVCKPVDFNKFITVIETICLYWCSVNKSTI